MIRYVIGDIHGQIDKLQKLIEFIDSDDGEFIFIGDYIDKGHNSKKVVEYLIELAGKRKCIFLVGNHEYAWNSYLTGNNKYINFLLQYGGIQCLEDYLGKKIDSEEAYALLIEREFATTIFPERHKYFLSQTQPYCELEQYVCVHAGINPLYEKKNLSEHNIVDMVFIRQKFINSKFLFRGKRVIFGHTAFEKPCVDSYKIGIDTGAVYSQEAALTAINLDEMSFITHKGNCFSANEYSYPEILKV